MKYLKKRVKRGLAGLAIAAAISISAMGSVPRVVEWTSHNMPSVERKLQQEFKARAELEFMRRVDMGILKSVLIEAFGGKDNLRKEHLAINAIKHVVDRDMAALDLIVVNAPEEGRRLRLTDFRFAIEDSRNHEHVVEFGLDNNNNPVNINMGHSRFVDEIERAVQQSLGRVA